MDCEKIVNSIKACAHHPNHDCASCDYCDDNLWCYNDQLIEDLEVLLKDQEKHLEEYEKLSKVLFKIDKYFKIKDLGLIVDGIENGRIVVLQENHQFPVTKDSPFEETTIKIRRYY